jgi:hypothetical protein
MLLMVLIIEMAFAPARLAARAGLVMSVMFGVSLTMTGISAASMTQPTMASITSGFWPTAEPMPRSHMPCGQPKFSSTPSAPAIARTLHIVVPVLARIGHQGGDDGVVRPHLFALRDLAEIGLRGTVADELDVVEAHHALPLILSDE